MRAPRSLVHPLGARSVLLVTAVLALGPSAAAAQATADVPFVPLPAAVVDLGTDAGAGLVDAVWRYSDARVIEVAHRSPGADLKASGPPNRTWDIEPKAGAADFDDASWPVIPASSLDQRRSGGRLAFNWYRLSFTIPSRIGSFDPTGATAVFEVVVDDYAEVWVNGQLPVALGQAGGQLVKGFNAPNRVVVGRDLKPGQRISIAVFGANGPLSSPPGNFIWIRSATLEFYRPATVRFDRVPVSVVRADPAINAVVPADPVAERLATGFQFVEGPVWVRDGGYLLFSDPNANRVYRWSPDGQVSVYRTKSGYAGPDIGEYHQPGSNGLALDPNGLLTINEHGRRRVVRLERNGSITVLADQYQGKRLNSPNDLVYRSDGALFFTDPPFGLPKVFDDPRKELAFSGIYMLKDGTLTLIDNGLTGPNGIAFSPDERYLYVSNWDTRRKVVMRYEVRADGSIGAGSVFYDLTGAPGEEALDGLKVDRYGNVYVSGPGGVWIIGADGRHLGTLVLPELPANFAWGDDDGQTLYLTARTGLYRVRLNVAGAGWPTVQAAR